MLWVMVKCSLYNYEVLSLVPQHLHKSGTALNTYNHSTRRIPRAPWTEKCGQDSELQVQRGTQSQKIRQKAIKKDAQGQPLA